MSKFRKFFIKHFGYDRRNALRYDLLEPVLLKTDATQDIPAFGLELSETGILLQVDSCCVWQLVLAHLRKLTLAHLRKLTGPDSMVLEKRWSWAEA